MSNTIELKPKRTRGPRGAAPEKLRVLVVDDDHSILEILKSALSLPQDLDVAVSDNAADAISQITRSESPFDILMFDVNMPDMDGIALCKTIRQKPGYRDTPIIMLTAMTDRNFIDNAFVSGATDYVTKPFDFLELRSRIRAAERLAADCKQARRAPTAAHQSPDDSTPAGNLDDPFSIDGIGRVLRFSEFDNYVLQLSQGKASFSFVTAIKIQNIERIHSDLSDDDFQRTIREVATGLVQETAQTGEFFSYRGGGVFLCVSHGRNLDGSRLSEPTLRRRIAATQVPGQPKTKLQVITGEPISMRSATKSGTLISLSKAVDSVLARETVSASAGTHPNEINRGFGAVADDPRPKFGVFDSFIRDLFRSDPQVGKTPNN